MKTQKNKFHISSTQFFVLFCLCFFSPSTVFLPKLITNVAGNAAWISPLVSLVAFVLLFWVLKLVLSSRGSGWLHTLQGILGKTFGLIVSLLIAIWCTVLGAFFVRHFAERVILVYLSDASHIFVILSLMLVVILALLGGMLSYARLCEVLFYFFVVLFVVVTALALFDGIKLDNVLPVVPQDTIGILHGALYMALPFSIVVYMSFFADRVNFDRNKLLRQGIKSSVFITILTSVILVLTVGQLGVFGVQYLQLPYFSITRQIAFLGPLKNIGSIVFSLWILADFALVATLLYTAASIWQRILKKQRRNIPIFVVVIIASIIAIFAWRDMFALEKFLNIVVIPVSVCTSIGIPLLLLIVGLLRKKIGIKEELNQISDSDNSVVPIGLGQIEYENKEDD
ncbi:MAG: spore germination protein [Firmicutes bacterium]|nr:spore germination protein [Bacillota bacterium]MCL1953820.1 spore germination protein [Bacillota bacterium]